MNELATVNENRSGTSLAALGATDPFEQYADAVQPRTIVGTLLKFSKGDFLAGEQGDEIPKGTVFTANPDELLAGWVKWEGGKPVEHAMVHVVDGRSPPKRSELGDTDPSTWEKDNNGKPRDPWQFTNYLPLLSEEGVLFTFTTGSRGGVSAIADLCRRYSLHRKRHPDVHPIVALDGDSYQHPNKEYGRIKVPVFTPAGWSPKSKFDEAMIAAGLTPRASAPVPEDAQAEDAFSDEVPF